MAAKQGTGGGDCYAGTLPELPEVEAVRRLLDRHLTHARIARVELGRAGLRSPFPPQFEARLTGRTGTIAVAPSQVPVGDLVIG